MRNLFNYLLITSIFLASCSHEPEPIAYGQDSCDHCKMTIMDQKYGAEIITTKGKVWKFDAAECMVDFIKSADSKVSADADRFLTVDFAHPGTLIDAKTSTFLKDKAYQSPMGGNLASFTTEQLAENNLQSADGKILTWGQLLKQVP